MTPYSTYKPSGVEWLGDVPAHWQVRKLRHMLRMATERNRPDLPLLSVVRERGVLVRDVSNREEKNHNFVPDDLANYKVVQRRQLAVNKMKAWQGSYGISRFLGIVSPAYYVFDVDDTVSTKYFHTAIRSKVYVPLFARASDGVRVGQWDLSLARMREIPFLVPTALEQAAIVRFLDHVDRRIRRYVRAKHKLIAVLEEQKQAVIQQAVTGRIDVRTGRPYPQYKPSGVVWLGKVPAHWEMRRLRTVAEMRVSNVDKHVKDGERPIRLCNYVDVYKNDHVKSGMKFMRATATPGEIERFRLRCGDVLITKDSEAWNDIGVPALVESTEDDIVCGYHLALLRPLSDYVDGGYLFRALQSSGVAHQLQVEANGVTRFGLTHSGIKSIWLPLPSLAEQAAIVRFLDHGDRRIRRYVRAMKKLVAKQSEMSLIDEYRTRLIADVVTGKLDVREAAAGLPDVDSAAIGDDRGDDGDPAEAPGVPDPERAADAAEHDADADVMPDERNHPAGREERA